MMKRVWQVLVFVLFTDEEVGVVLEVSRLNVGINIFTVFLCVFYDSMGRQKSRRRQRRRGLFREEAMKDVDKN